MNIDLLRKDECEPYTQEQMANIKSQFHPSNIANVNITPYHIYDEDGVEQVVGEVRKTIDGVKKCKPVYEKIIAFNGWSTQHGLSIDDVVQCEAIMIDGNNSFPLPYASTNASGYSITVVVNSTSIEMQHGSSWTSTPTMRVTLCYTKTSDEWQPV